MPETREQIVERMAQGLYAHRQSIANLDQEMDAWDDLPEDWQEEWREAATAALPVAVKAVTDRVREWLRKPHPLDTQERWRHCVCFICVDYRANLAMLDQIDAEMGGE